MEEKKQMILKAMAMRLRAMNLIVESISCGDNELDHYLTSLSFDTGCLRKEVETLYEINAS